MFLPVLLRRDCQRCACIHFLRPLDREQALREESDEDAIDCEYDLSGNKFWREFLLAKVSDCPDPIEVE